MQLLQPNLKWLLGIGTLSLILVMSGYSVQAQITPEVDSNTIVTPNGDAFNIDGGETSTDGTNLFHSFEQFGLNSGQTANFIANPATRNILGRVIGGEASIIDGLIRVTNSNANLYLMNPAGIIFGSNARLDVSASFFGTTATGISFGSNNWFNAIGSNDYAVLVGNPSAFGFTTNQPGSIVNAGNLTVKEGQSLTLLGGTVVNTGQVSAPKGQITIAAVPGKNIVRLSQTGNLLSLDIQPISSAESLPENWTLPISSLPKLLTGGDVQNATGLTVNDDGTVELTGSGLRISTNRGTAVASGKLDTSNPEGGKIQIFGNKVGLVDVILNASGTNSNGTISFITKGVEVAGDITTDNSNIDFKDSPVTLTDDTIFYAGTGRISFGKTVTAGDKAITHRGKSSDANSR